MGCSSAFSTSFLLLLLPFVPIYGKPLVPALFIFGDSSLDVGNNNYLPTIIKANFPPYGRDFVNHLPTGRFSNGKIVIDFASETLGFITYQPPYLSAYIKGKYLLNGVNFASSGSGYLDSTANLYSALSISKQLECYKDYQEELVKIAGRSNASSIISGAIYIVGFGTGDFFLNYYINPLLNKVHTPYQFSDILVQNYANFIQNLYALGARKIGVPTLAPIGCLPAAITLFGSAHSKECVVKINNGAIYFNQKLNSTSVNLRKMLPGLNLAILDAYKPFFNLVTNPSEYGFSETRKGCFGTSLLENIPIINNKKTIITICPNASKYIFWDGLHPTEATNKYMAAELIADAMPLIS